MHICPLPANCDLFVPDNSVSFSFFRLPLAGVSLIFRVLWEIAIDQVIFVRSPLALILDLVVSCEDLSITRWRRAIARPHASISMVHALLYRFGMGCHRRPSIVGIRRTVAHVGLSSGWFWLSASAAGTRRVSASTIPSLLVNNHIRHTTVAMLPIVDTLVVGIIGLGILGDDVPRVKETRDVAQ